MRPGESRTIGLKFSESYLGMPITVPVHVIRAVEDGPRVLLTAAVHGDELNGLGIIRELLFARPFALRRGTIVAVPVVNTMGLERHMRYAPDRRDLNRCFPGAADGSLASRLASALFSQVVKKCDYGIDLHTAAVRRTNYPTVRGDLDVPAVRRLAESFGAEVVVHSKGPLGSLRRTGVEHGVPLILFEAGEVWKIEPAVVEIGVRGCLNVLRTLKMVEGSREVPGRSVRIKKLCWVRAEDGGVLNFLARPGDLVAKGQELASTSTVFGRPSATVLAPANGMVLGMTTLPVVKPGEPLYHIGSVAKRDFARLMNEARRDSADEPLEKVRNDLSTSVLVHE